MRNGNDERPRGIGGTDAIRIVEGKWKELWLEKTGQSERADLSDILPVQLGIFTEKFNRQWYTKTTSQRVVSMNKVWTHPEIDYIYGSLDGVVNGKVWEAKHTNPFSKEDTILERYYPQLQHYMFVTGFKKSILSVLYGTMRYKIYEVNFDEKFSETLLKACALFWYHVENNIVPPDFMDFKTIEGINNAEDVVKTFGIEISDVAGIQRTLN